ncbi:MAG: hypothetical protein Q4C12_03485 [Clostridia bacterium]|nr:hypothetical protein [Clostridia bacterium]
MKRNVSQLSLKTVILSLFISVLLWSIVTDAWGYTKIFHVSNDSWGNYIFDFFSRLIWSAPAILLLLKYKRYVPTSLKQLFANTPEIKPLAFFVVIIVMYHVLAMFYNHGALWINPSFHFEKHFLCLQR